MRIRLASFLAALLVPLLVLAAEGDSVDSSRWTKEYDPYFQKYSKRYFGPNFDWKWFKAQSIAESGLNPQAVSVTGARGLMQILPSTYAEIRGKNPYFSHINEPRWNIAAGIYYNRYLYREWPQIPEGERLFFTFGSYNAGLGGMRSAYRRGGSKARNWKQVAPHAPQETRHYVARIHQLKDREDALQAVPGRLRLKMLSEAEADF